MAFPSFGKFSQWAANNPVLNRSSRVFDDFVAVIVELPTLFFGISNGVLGVTKDLFFVISDAVLSVATAVSLPIITVTSEIVSDSDLPIITVTVTIE